MREETALFEMVLAGGVEVNVQARIGNSLRWGDMARVSAALRRSDCRCGMHRRGWVRPSVSIKIM